MEQQHYEPGQTSFRTPDTAATLDSTGLVATYETHLQAEAALKFLQKSGFDMKKLSIIGKDFETDENVIGFYNMGDRAKYWGKLGAFWGGLWGLLFGSAFFLVPGVGPIVVAGTFVSVLAGIIEGMIVVGGLSALGAALYSLGIPKDSVLQYETEIKAGKYILLAHGSTEDLKKAKEIINSSGGKNINEFDSQNSDKNLQTDQSVTTY